MPNMDDIAFFDTESLEHRGGIWSEACRKSQVPTTVSEVGVQADSSASTPVVMTVSSDSTSSASAQRVDDDPSIQSASPATNVLFEILPSPSTNPDDSSDSWHNTTSRRSWFSSTRSDDTAGASIPTFFTDDHHGDTPEEGRDCPSESDKSTVANFRPSKDYPDLRSTTLDTTVTVDEQESLQMFSSRPPSSRRSVSQHSVKVKTQFDSEDQESVNPQNTSAPSTPRKVSDASEKVARPSSPPSFFSTFKSKTADKQAIKETAKEAIRKWGVNWGGFRKDGSITTDNNPASDTSRPGVLHAEGSAKALAHRPRASYAEVRAAVVERKEREKISQPLESGSEPTAQHLPSQPETSSVPLSPNTLTTNPETSVDSVPASRLVTPSGLTQKKSPPSINTETEAQQNLQPLLSEEPIKQTPIHVQPIAKTMSIPGIHASHRGEVQSMGYVAPQPQPPQVPVKETMLKNPAIQTVYRFLKSSNNGDRNKHDTSEGQNQDDQQDNPPLSSAQTILKTSDNHSESTTPMPILQSYDHDTSKSLPPPLPPRSQSKATLHSSRNQGPLSFSPPLSASGDLKNIVEKDERSRIKTTDPDLSTGVYSPQEWQPGDDNCEQAASRIQSTDIHDLLSDSSDLYSSDALRPKSSTNIGKPPPLPPRRSKTPTSDSTVESS